MITLLVLDTETTGVKPEKDRPCQICMIEDGENGNRVLLNMLVNPCMPISEGATKVNGITDEQVQSAPDYVVAAVLANHLYSLVKPDLIVGYNSKSFDEPMLSACYGKPVFDDTPHLDVLDALYRFFPELPGHKLGQAYLSLIGKELEGAHNAFVDALATLELMRHMCKRIGIGPTKLAAEMSVPKPYSILPISPKHKGKLLDDVPVGWARWMKNNPGNMRPDLAASIDYILNR